MAFINDGFSTTVSFPGIPGLVFREVTVQPVGLDSNGEVDTTTMRNTRWRTKQPKHLITATEMNLTASYDPVLLYSVGIINAVGVVGSVLVTFPDGSVLTFLGWLDKFVPQPLKEGEFPLADVKIHASNQTTPVGGAPSVEVPPSIVAGGGLGIIGGPFGGGP